MSINSNEDGSLAAFLTGVKVVELSQYIPGPYAALMLADYGASVVKIEPPAGDPMRRLGLPVGADGLAEPSTAYQAMNAGKRIVRMDMKSAEGQAAAEALIADADVLIESFRPGVMDRLGLSRARLNELNPELIHCAITGFGQNSPLAAKAGHDVTYMALAGMLTGTGTPEKPMLLAPPVSDYAAAMQAAIEILAALAGRNSGQASGCYIDIAMSDAVLSWQATFVSQALAGKEAPRGAGSETGGLACYNIYETADGRFVSLAPEEPRFWANFCQAVAKPDWIARHHDPVPQTTLTAEVAELFRSAPAAHWDTLLANVDCCFQSLVNPAELPDEPHVVARKLAHRIGPTQVEILHPAWLNGNPPAPRPRLVEIVPEDIATGWSLAV